MDSGYLTVILNSSDAGTQGDASDFYASIPSLDLVGEWEVVLTAINFPKSSVGNSVYILADICDVVPVGNTLMPLLCRIPPLHASDSDPIVWELSNTVVPWKKVITSNVSQIHVELFESNGTAIPTGVGRYTTLELIFRRVG
jgi:hypothetical protein